ncbi:MAG: hypothetical protein V4463_00420 [Pseudomonadota bacterium]
MSAFDRYLRPRSERPIWLSAATVLCAISATWLSAVAYQNHSAAQETLVQVDLLKSRQAALASAKPSQTEAAGKKAWITFLLERDFAWTRVFNAVERVASPDIELLDFQPEKTIRVLVLRGEAKNREALSAFANALAAQKVFANVHLVRQETRRSASARLRAWDGNSSKVPKLPASRLPAASRYRTRQMPLELSDILRKPT